MTASTGRRDGIGPLDIAETARRFTVSVNHRP